MKIDELYSKYIKSSEQLLLEYSPQKTESLVTHFHQKHPEFSIPTITFAVKRFAELLNSKTTQGEYLLKDTDNERDIDAIIAKDNNDGWGVIYNIVLNNTKPGNLPQELSNIPDIPELIIDSNGVKVWEASTKLKCDAIRAIIQSTPSLRESFYALPREKQTSPGNWKYGWCVTFKDNPHYYQYREGLAGHPERTFYFIYDENRNTGDEYHMSVLQPFVRPHRDRWQHPQVDNDLMLTNVVNGGDRLMTYDQVFNIYPVLANHRELLKYVPTHIAEKATTEFTKKNYQQLNPIKREQLDSYLFRWFTVNTKKPMPLKRFLKMNQEFQNAFIKTRAMSLFFTNPPNNLYGYTRATPFTDDTGTTMYSIESILKILIKEGRVAAARNIASLYNSLPNVMTIRLDSKNNPILDNGDVVTDRITDLPLVIEKLPISKTVVYGRKEGVYIYKKNEAGSYDQIQVDKETLEPEDKKFVEEVEKVIQLIKVATKNIGVRR